MKFLALFALIATASAEPSTPGTPCMKADDTCGDAATMCCGVATGGKMCKTLACAEVSSTNPVPNFVVCNTKTSPADFVLT